MALSYPPDMVGRQTEWRRLEDFCKSGQDSATLGIVWGRRRVGKSFLLQSIADQTQGFYYGAVRGSKAEALRELGARIAADQDAPAPLLFDEWDSAVHALLDLGKSRERVVILDEYPYLLEHSPELDSVIQRFLEPRSRSRVESRTRLIICGSALSVMRAILSGTAPLRGRAGMDLRISPFDFRTARELHGIDDLRTAVNTFAVIGGVAAYAREMTADDLPEQADDFDRWISDRVLSPAAPLFSEIPLLLSEDPATAKARKLNLYHATLAAIATGNHAHSKITRYVKTSGAALAPILEALVAAELVEQVQDPIRENRPTYHPADSLIRFHYAGIRPHQARLARHGADTLAIWSSLQPTFRSQVLGPSFEGMARFWARHFADPELFGGYPDYVGPTTLTLADGTECEIDVVVAAADSDTASERTVRALGEAKVGERLSIRHLKRLEAARAALGERGARAKIILIGTEFQKELLEARRPDLKLVDLERLYHGD